MGKRQLFKLIALVWDLELQDKKTNCLSFWSDCFAMISFQPLPFVIQVLPTGCIDRFIMTFVVFPGDWGILSHQSVSIHSNCRHS